MGTSYRSEYVGFTVNESTRDYTLRVSVIGRKSRNFSVAISNDAFLTRLVRYQDAPGICFLKLKRALSECAELPATRLTVTDDELREYRETHAPRPGKRRWKYPAAVVAPEPRDDPDPK